MAEKREKPKTFVTPKGEFLFPKMNEPDTKFKEDGEYGVKLVLDGPEAEALSKQLLPIHAEAIRKGREEYSKLAVAVRKKNEFKELDLASPEYDKDENETGRSIFNFKMRASGKSKEGKAWSRRPAIFDARGKPYGDEVPQIWSGTIGKVSFTAMPFFTVGVGAGLSLRLEAVQVIELRTGGQRSAAAYGFGNEGGEEEEEVESFKNEAASGPNEDF